MCGPGGIGPARAQEIADGLRQHNFHDGLAKPSRGDRAGFTVRITTASDERGITDAAWKFAAGAASGSRGVQPSLLVERYGTDGSLLVAAMVLGRMTVLAATFPGFPFGRRNKIFRIAKRNSTLVRELFGALADQHHVRANLEDPPRSFDGIFDPTQPGYGTGFQRGGVHDHGVAFDVAIEIQMRTIACVEYRIVFEDGNGGLNGIECMAAVDENGVARMQRTEAA